jgi:tetratricopeptide (TPR) repeat protein
VKRPQLIVVFTAIVLVLLLTLFGRTAHKPVHSDDDGHDHSTQPNNGQSMISEISFDTLLAISKQSLTPDLLNKLNTLEKDTNNKSNNINKIEAIHQLAHFWKDDGRAYIPYAWYTAEGARLENSEKNLTFAGHLFLDAVRQEQDAIIKRWMALQSKDLFERALKINPNNDSAKVSMGAAYIFGGISEAPMEGIAKVKEVTDKDSTNVYAQITLATASMMSGQIDKAATRLHTVLVVQPKNLQALLMLGDVAERQGNKEEAIKWYSQSLPLITRDDIKAELEKRIKELKK